MLVLTRRLDDIITIGDPRSDEAPIEIQLADIWGDQVRLGITARRKWW